MSLRRVSAGSGANGHTAVVALRGRTPGERGWFDRNCHHRARSLLGDHKLEEPSRDLPTGLGIGDPRDRMTTTTSSKSIRGSSSPSPSRVRSADFITSWNGGRAEAVCAGELRSLGAVYFYTTFIRVITSLLQIRQVARLRSTTCNLQGLSPTQRSTQTTPSRDLTLGGQGTKKETPKDQQSPRSRSPSPAREYSLERKPKVAVLPRCLRAMKPIGDSRRRKEEGIAVVWRLS